MILLDTTVLVYAVGEEHPLRRPCRAVLEAHGEGTLVASTTVEVIQEFTHVRGNRRSRHDAATLARHYANAFDLVPTTVDDLGLALDLFERHAGLGAFDALLASAALRVGADALVSADGAFGLVDGLPWVDPADERAIRRLTKVA